MWNFFRGSKKGREKRDIDSVFKALDEGAAERPLPTLVCRTCGLKYPNTGTFMQGSRCPQCFPDDAGARTG